MSNQFWNYVTRLVSGGLAKADDVNASFDGVAAGFTLVEANLASGITVTNETGTTAINSDIATRALKVISFDINGNVIATTSAGAWLGDWQDATNYSYRDIVKDAAGDLGQNNIYICTVDHVSGSFISDDVTKWDLLIDVEEVAAYASAAQASAVAAAASYDSFDDRYLGAKASDPTVDNDGDPLIVGALYFNSTDDKMYVWNSGLAWATVSASAADVGIADAGGYLAAGNVEAALQEIAVDTRHITVTQPVNLDSIESQLATNTSKLSGIESGATGDQTDAEIKTAYENNANTNEFSDAEQTKLLNIEDSATQDQTPAQIKAAYEGIADTNAFTDSEKTSLATMEDGADVTDTANVTAAGALMDSEVDADLKTLSLPASTTITSFAQTLLDDTTANAMRATLDVAQAGTGGLTDAQIKTAYEANPDTNEFNDAEKTKLGTVDTNADETTTTNVRNAGALMDDEVDVDLKTLSLPPLTTISVWVQGLLDDGSASAARSTLGLSIGSNIQAYSSILDNTTSSFTTTLKAKLDAIEAGADVTDAANVQTAGALMDSEVDADIKTLSLPANTSISVFGASLIDDVAAVNAQATLGLVIGTNVQAHSAILDSTTSAFTTAQATRLANMEDNADVTDTANVTSAGAVMDSEVDADIKTLSLPASTVITTFGKSLVGAAAASNARSTLGVDPAGTSNYTHPNHSGHVYSASDGATSLLVAAITGQTAVVSGGIDSDDELLISVDGAIRRMDISVLTDYIQANSLSFPAGTAMLFQQTAAPTGWTKSTSYDNHCLKVETGTVGSGGTLNFTTFLADAVTGSTTSGLPSHSHTGPSHSHSVANHTHTINHDHPAATSGTPSANHSHTIAHTHTVAVNSNNQTYEAQVSQGGYSSPRAALTSSGASAGSSGNVSAWHTHSTNPANYSGSSGSAGAQTSGESGTGATSTEGSGSNHNHSLAQDIKYVDVIIATKN